LSLSAAEIRAVLDEIEEANSKIHGYGSLNFARNLRQCYQNLCERDVREADLKTVMGFAERILECPMEVIEGVPETLEYLSLRHDLTLFTKGHPEEQKLKVERSGLAPFFHHAAIVREKDRAAYRRLVEERAMDSARAWMIGNSPKSDINPALEAGLKAVFVPHAHPWVLEKQEIQQADGRLLILDRFTDLRLHF
jgi:putative hydrolase of the HAD superfamily